MQTCNSLPCLKGHHSYPPVHFFACCRHAQKAQLLQLPVLLWTTVLSSVRLQSDPFLGQVIQHHHTYVAEHQQMSSMVQALHLLQGIDPGGLESLLAAYESKHCLLSQKHTCAYHAYVYTR